MSSNINTFLKDNEVLEVEKLELYFLDYLSVPRAERVNIYFNLLNTEINLSEFESKYGSYLYGYNIKFKNNKKCVGNENIIIKYNTDVCFFYTEYRICFLLDISQSFLIYDFYSQILNIEKLEIYLKYTIREMLNFQKIIKTVKNEDVLYTPKLVLSFVATGTDEDCDILSHEIYLDKSNFDEHFDNVIKKLKKAIMDFHNCKRKDNSQIFTGMNNINNNNNNIGIQTNSNINSNNTNIISNYNYAYVQNKYHTSYLNKMLDQSLYILDLLPRSGAPILIIFTDSNLCIAKIGKYNNILMQYNRVDINIHIVDLYSSNNDLNLFSLGFIKNETIMKHICKFTGGCYFNEQKLNQILKLPQNKNNLCKNILNYGKEKKIEKISDNYNSSNNHLKCFNCQNSIDVFFCKKPFSEKVNTSFLWINNEILEQLKKSLSELGFNFTAIDSFSITNGMKVYQKETFERYTINIPIQRITESRIRESFKMMKTNYKGDTKNKIKFEIPVLPDVTICYIAKGKSEKGLTFDNDTKHIRIKIKAPFYIFNHLKLEYIRNRGSIEKSQNCNLNKQGSCQVQGQGHTNIEKIMKFIKEIICTDKLLSTFCFVFTLDKEFQNKDNGEKEMFISSNKQLWELLSNLSLHTWHRFFNVETLELMVNNTNIILEEEMKNFYYTTNRQIYNTKNKQACEKIIHNFCDITKPEQNFGIKLIHKTINNTNKRFQNGFCMVRIVWMYENVCLVYLAFFQSFINVRRKTVERLVEDLQHGSGNNIQITSSNRHLVFLVPPMPNDSLTSGNLQTIKDTSTKENNTSTKKNKNEKESGLFESQCASIFTYRPYKKLIETYIFKKTFKYSNSNKFIMEKFICFLLNQRIKENFTFLNSNTKGIILVTKISVSKVRNVEEIELDNSKIISKRCLMLYIMQLSPNKDELIIELSVEPVSGYYLFKFSEKEAKIFDERNFFISLTNYYKNLDKEIFESVKNFCVLMRETIQAKLAKEPIDTDIEVDSNIRKVKKVKSSYKLTNIFSKRSKKECLYNTYLCFANEELKKNHNKLINNIELFKKDLKEFGENILDDKNPRNKYTVDSIKRSLELMKEAEYKILEKQGGEKVGYITLIEKMVVDRFYSFFYELFNSIMDYKFEDEEKCSLYAKILSKTTLLIIRYPSIDKLLTCCKNQSQTSLELVIHVKFFFLSIDKLKPNEKNFAEILFEKNSLKTFELKEDGIVDSKEKDHHINSVKIHKMNFWDDNQKKNSFEIKESSAPNSPILTQRKSSNFNSTANPFNYTKNEWFENNPIDIFNNMIDFIEDFYEIIYNKNNMITYIENSEGDLDEILETACSYTVQIDITDLISTNVTQMNTGLTNLSIEFIWKKLHEIFTQNLKLLSKNYYSNERITKTNDIESDNTNSLNDDNDLKAGDGKNNDGNLINATYEKVKDLFLIELNISESLNGDVHSYPVNVNDKEKFKELIKEIYSNQLKYKSGSIFNSNINLTLKIYFVPEIEDIYSDVNIDEIREDNLHITSINMEDYSIYYYDFDALSKMVPAYIEYHNRNYFISISKKQKSHIKNIYSKLTSLQNIVQLEMIRHSYNLSNERNKIDYLKIYELLNTIHLSYFHCTKMSFEVVSKSKILTNFDLEENEMNLFIIKKNESRIYMIDFENNNENVFGVFKKFCYDKLENENIKEENYKIPMWLMFYLASNIDKRDFSKRKFSIDDFKNDEICFEIRWLYIDEAYNMNVKKEEIADKIKELIKYYIKSINKKILLANLKENNICDDRLLPPAGYQKYNEMNLEQQSTCKYYVDVNLEEVYAKLNEDAKLNYKVENREDIFKITYPINDEIFLFKISLQTEEKNEKKSFLGDSFNNNGSMIHFNLNRDKFKKSTISGVSNLEDSRLSLISPSKNYFILIELYGLQQPSQNIMKMIKDFVNEKISLIKLNYYLKLLNNLDQVKNVKEYEFLSKSQNKLLENANKINDAIKNLFNKAKLAWNTLFSSQQDITKFDIELICNFSDRINLELVNQNFEPLGSMSRNYFDNVTEYFKVFRDNKIINIKCSEEQKILIIPDIQFYAFLVKVF